MKRKRVHAKGEDLLAKLKLSILRVLADEKATIAERMRAIEIGAKIVAIERKHTDGDSGGGFFD